MKSGGELAVGDRWSAKLGTKLYGMTARPHLTFTVTAERLISGTKIYSIEASGSAPMKEPVMTASGEPLGYATGTAWISAHFEYDRDNRRLVSMRADLTDTLRYAGPTKHVGGRVKDHQHCEVSLDQSALRNDPKQRSLGGSTSLNGLCKSASFGTLGRLLGFKKEGR